MLAGAHWWKNMAIWLKLLKTLTHTHTNKSISLEVVQRRQMVTGPLSYWLLHILAAPTLACWFTFLAPAWVCIARSRFRGNTRQTVTDHLPPDCIFSVHRFTSWWFTFVHCSWLKLHRVLNVSIFENPFSSAVDNVELLNHSWEDMRWWRAAIWYHGIWTKWV